MSNKTIIFIGMSIGSLIGSYIPALWGESMFSMSSIILTAVGGLVGIWAGFKLTAY